MENTDAFELEIVRQTETKKVSILWVEVQSPTGNFIVGPEHHPLVSLLKHKSKLTYKAYSGGETSIDVYGGLFKVANNKAVALLD